MTDSVSPIETAISGSDVLSTLNQIILTLNSIIATLNGGGGLSNPFADDTLAAPALYASDATSGFGFSATTGLPGLSQDGGNCIAEMVAVAGFSQKSEGFQIGGTSDGGGISLLVLAPPSGSTESWAELDSFGNSVSGIELLRISGTKESPAATISGTLGYIYFGGARDASNSAYGARIAAVNIEDFSDGHLGTGVSIATCAVGSASLTERLTIDGDGNTQITNGLLILGYPSNTYTVSGLPTAAPGLKGAKAFVTDATAPVFAATLTGLGGVFCPVYCDGTAWRAG